jgi:diguanylate cyclase (GGDEF)-like protein
LSRHWSWLAGKGLWKRPRCDRAEPVTPEVEPVAQLDLLTGCFDRYGFVTALDGLIATGARPLVMKFDVERFREINNGYGHDVGDALLRLIARRIDRLGASIVARVGSDEFAVATAVEHREEALVWLGRLQDVLGRQYALPGAEIDVLFATGFVIGACGEDGITLVRQAGAALSHAKAKRLGGAQEFNQNDWKRARGRLRLTSELQHAVVEQEFLFHYQPKVDLATGEIVGAEALLRWQHDAFGLQLPERFIALAEETGLILDIGHWGRCEVARFATLVNRCRAKPLRFSINVSALELRHRDVVASMQEALDRNDADPKWLIVELTETTMAQTTHGTPSVLHELREMGLGLSVDDFGTGYSSLSYLEQLPLTEIKIDKSFVRDVPTSASKRIIVKAVIDLGREKGLDVVAEGIETRSEHGMLRVMGCSYGQGWMFGPPIEMADFAALAMRLP